MCLCVYEGKYCTNELYLHCIYICIHFLKYQPPKFDDAMSIRPERYVPEWKFLDVAAIRRRIPWPMNLMDEASLYDQSPTGGGGSIVIG